MKNATEIVLVIDESGSMSGIRKDTIGSINSFLADQKKVDGECNVTIRTFDTGRRRVIREGALQSIRPISEDDYQPLGGTPLLDAVGEAIDALGDKLRARAESERPDKVIFVIITDGEENSSTKFNLSEIKRKITTQQDTYKWAFIFLGAGLDAFAQGGDLGIKFSGIAQYQNTPKGYAGMFNITSQNIAQARQSGNLNAVTFTASQQDEIKKTY